MSEARLFLLGPPRLEDENGAEIDLKRRKSTALLAYLAHRGGVHSRESLATLLWPDYDGPSSLANLRRDLSRLRGAVGEQRLVVDRMSAGMQPEAGFWLDTRQFKDALERVRAHAHPPGKLCAACLGALERAVELYRGDFMQGFSLPDSSEFADWQFFESEGLRGELAEALEALVHWHAGQGEYERGLSYARRWVELDPLVEAAQRWLMKLYAWSGQVAAAGRQHDDLARALKEQLGVDPEEETETTWRLIRTRKLPPPQVAAGAGQAAPAADQRLVRLPVETGGFIGRRAQLERLERLLGQEDVRLVTVVGLGGVGKTRLALAAAQRMANAFDDGVVFVPLVGVDHAEGLPGALARALEISLGGRVEPLEEVCNYLNGRELLFVLDGFEQLLEGVGVIKSLLGAGRGVKLLVTSREPLYLDVEWRLDLEGMRYPLDGSAGIDDGEYDAIELFIESARQVRAGFGERYARDGEVQAAVARLCRMVAGMPLAIKLAAAWLRVMDVESVATEVARSLDILTSRMRDVPERQRSMRVIFETTWNQLAPDEQRMFAALSVFRGGFNDRGAGEVAEVVPYQLAGLVDRGLVHYSGDGVYNLQALTRQFAWEQLLDLGADEPVIRRYCAYYLEMIQSHAEGLRGADPLRCLHVLRKELENLDQAWEWSLARGMWELVEASITPLADFYMHTGLLRDGEKAFAQALEHIQAPHEPENLRLAGRLWVQRLIFRLEQGVGGDVKPEVNLVLEMAEKSGDPRLMAEAAFMHGLASMYWEQPELALDALERSRQHYRQLGDLNGLAYSLNLTGELLSRINRPQEAAAYLEEALEIGKRTGDVRLQALSRSHMGVTYYYSDNYQSALEYWERALRVFEALEDVRDAARTANNLGFVYHILGMYEQALAYSSKSVQDFKQIGDYGNEAAGLDTLGAVYLVLGDYQRARACFQQALSFGRQHRQGHLHIAMYLASLAEVDIAMGEYTAAEHKLLEASRLMDEMGHPKEISRVVAMHAALDARLGRHEAALHGYEEALGLLDSSEERSENARISVEKGHLLLDLGRLDEAAGVLQRAEELSRASDRLPSRFAAGLALARLEALRGDRAAATARLTTLDELILTEYDEAALAYERWRCGGDAESGQHALALYRRLSARSGDALSGGRVAELTEAIGD